LCLFFFKGGRGGDKRILLDLHYRIGLRGIKVLEEFKKKNYLIQNFNF